MGSANISGNALNPALRAQFFGAAILITYVEIMLQKFLLYTPLVLLCLLLSANVSQAKITLQMGANRTFWKGCILQKVPLFSSETNLNIPCNKCAMSRNSSLVVRRKGWPQRMYNCTDFCDRVTICTHAKYFNGKDKHPYPLCYHCQNKKTEDIKFNHILLDEICLDDCRNCSVITDLPRAYECAHLCRGLPTFCYPKLKVFTHRLCYQASRWYGCDVEPVDTNISLSAKCKVCASLAKNNLDAQECAAECGGFPTFSEIGNNGSEKYYACQKKAKGNRLLLFP
ncbi:unnamed protein product [Allacma fusca]|uniref:Uncharacterized protein n=1 Tax=Allacma fusca TaxID=39272 RepID=A0A8J2L466_9HEXA|nr:unnamed protein product [Allacma fusca]